MGAACIHKLFSITLLITNRGAGKLVKINHDICGYFSVGWVNKKKF